MVFSFFKKKYTYSPDEEKLLDYLIETQVQMGILAETAKPLARTMLHECIDEAEKRGLRGVTNLGDQHTDDAEFMKKRLEAGLTEEDILWAWNRDYVILLAEDKLPNAIRMTLYLMFIEKDGMTPDEAVRQLRKMYIYYGDPDSSHKNYQGEDADIYPEFARRYEEWRSKHSPEEEKELAEQYSTYNAMVRDLIRKGEMRSDRYS